MFGVPIHKATQQIIQNLMLPSQKNNAKKNNWVVQKNKNGG